MVALVVNSTLPAGILQLVFQLPILPYLNSFFRLPQPPSDYTPNPTISPTAFCALRHPAELTPISPSSNIALGLSTYFHQNHCPHLESWISCRLSLLLQPFTSSNGLLSIPAQGAGTEARSSVHWHRGCRWHIRGYVDLALGNIIVLTLPIQNSA